MSVQCQSNVSLESVYSREEIIALKNIYLDTFWPEKRSTDTKTRAEWSGIMIIQRVPRKVIIALNKPIFSDLMKKSDGSKSLDKEPGDPFSLMIAFTTWKKWRTDTSKMKPIPGTCLEETKQTKCYWQEFAQSRPPRSSPSSQRKKKKWSQRMKQTETKNCTKPKSNTFAPQAI